MFSQELIFNSTPKRGMYKNFYEFKYNRPSIEFDYEIVEIKRQAFNELKTFYSLLVDKKDTLLPRDIYGFCSEEEIYLNLSKGKLYGSKFAKLEFLGRYSIYKGTTTVSINPAFILTYIIPNVLDVIDGDKFPVSAIEIENRIKDDPELLELYKEEKSKELLAVDYIIWYCERNLSRHIIRPIINDSTICKFDSDSSYQAYYQRIIDFGVDTSIIDIELREYYYGKHQLKMIGLKSKHIRGKNDEYFYKIGTWRKFHKNGNLKSIENYDFREKRNGVSLFYNKQGILIEEKNYQHGEEVKVGAIP